jgi:hypothetical protein
MKFIAPITRELIDSSQVAGDSPRLKWIKKYVVRLLLCTDDGLFHAISIAYKEHGAGLKEDDALAEFARKNKVRMWNEV